MAVTIDDIRQARVLLAGNVVRTPSSTPRSCRS